MFTRNDKLDFAWPTFANLGEQEVNDSELYVDWSTVRDVETTFGYQQRYAEYKHKTGRVAGAFRDTLDHWQLDRKFSSKPTLNETFVECNPDDRIFAVEGNEQVYVQVYHNLKVVRKLPYFANPKL